jgi:hypothetical protein
MHAGEGPVVLEATAGFNVMELQTAAREGLDITGDRVRRGIVDDGGAQRTRLVRNDFRDGPE